MELDSMALVSLVFRWLHILAAITAVGGTIFARAVVVPTVDELPEAARGPLHAAMRARWSKIVMASIGFLLISGLINYLLTSANFTVPKWYHMLFGIKFLLALAVFAIASFITGKTSVAESMRRNLRFWLNLNITLAVLVVCISGVLRTADKVPKAAAPPAAEVEKAP